MYIYVYMYVYVCICMYIGLLLFIFDYALKDFMQILIPTSTFLVIEV